MSHHLAANRASALKKLSGALLIWGAEMISSPPDVFHRRVFTSIRRILYKVSAIWLKVGISFISVFVVLASSSCVIMPLRTHFLVSRQEDLGVLDPFS